MDIKRTLVVLSLFPCLLATGLPAAGQSAGGYMDITEVQPGMRGYGLTVFQDARIDTFEVEVLGVMKNIFYAKHDIIMVGVSGPYVDDAGVIAGMSGSPVYIDGKLVGALAYRFGTFPMKPIGGVTPIGHMLAIRDALETEPAQDRNAPGGNQRGQGEIRGETGPGGLGGTGDVSADPEFSGPSWPGGPGDVSADPVFPGPLWPGEDGTSADPVFPGQLWPGEDGTAREFSGQPGIPSGPSNLKPIAVPMVFSGFHPMTVSLFENDLRRRGLVPLAGGASSGTSGTVPAGDDSVTEQAGPASSGGRSSLEPGAAVSAQLIRGDYNLSGTGTVTWRDEDAILAFGHPFLWTGALNIPMNRADIITVIPDQIGSTKISSVADEVGSVLWDHTNGIYGQLGDTARMIPVELSYDDAGGTPRTYLFDVMMANGWTPLLVNMAVANAIIANGRAAGERTITLGGRIELRGHPDVIFEDQFSGQGSLPALARDVNGVLDFVLDNRFVTPMIESLSIEIQSSNERRTAVIEDVWFGSETVKPGDTLEVRVFLRPYRGDRVVKRLDVTIPKTLSNGPVQVLVGSSQAVLRHDLNAVPQRYRPTDGPRLIELLNNRRTGNRVYLKMFQGGAGGMVKGREMPGLPPSVLAVMNSERTKGSFVPIREKVVAEETVRTDYVIAGQNWSRLTAKR